MFYTMFAAFILIGGLILVISSVFFINYSETAKLFFGIGGGFISTISAFPIREIILRIEKIKTYKFLEENIQNLTGSELKKVNELMWNSLERVI